MHMRMKKDHPPGAGVLGWSFNKNGYLRWRFGWSPWSLLRIIPFRAEVSMSSVDSYRAPTRIVLSMNSPNRERTPTFELMAEAHRRLAIARQNVESEARALVEGSGSMDALRAFLACVDLEREALRRELTRVEALARLAATIEAREGSRRSSHRRAA